jgi:DNA primase
MKKMGQYIDFAYVKTNANFQAVLGHYNIDNQGDGDEIRCNCPFHDDETPSLSVNTDKKVFTCHADNCGEKGNILDFVNLMEGECGLREAAKRLAVISQIPCSKPKPARNNRQAKTGNKSNRKNGATFSQTGQQKGFNRSKKSVDTEAKAAAKAAIQDGEPLFDDDDEPTESLKPLSFTLTLDPDHEYGVERMLTASAIKRFEMGYCNRGMMKGRWCVPIHDVEGQVVAYCGRWVGKKRPKKEPKYKMPANFRKKQVLFNLHRVLAMQSSSVVIVEGTRTDAKSNLPIDRSLCCTAA